MGNLWIPLLLVVCAARFAPVHPQALSSSPSSAVDASSAAFQSGLSASRSGTRSGTSSASSTAHSKSSPSEMIISGTRSNIDRTSSSASFNGTGTLGTPTMSGPATVTEEPTPTNTQPCNEYVEFCTRSYGNITFVGTHNSPFIRKSNAAANQELDVVTQLNDGVRMLQGQTHMVNNTLYYCHTSCEILNAGTVESYLTTVADWIREHPFEVVTIVIGNGDFVDIEKFVDPMEKSGLATMAYVPEKDRLLYSAWPTLSQLILLGKRAVIFVDYKADQKKVPYLLDEFGYMFETPFSQTDAAFPCNVDRPPNQTATDGKLYMANHNLNVAFDFAGTQTLIPNVAVINQTNNVTGFGSLGLQSEQCEAQWLRYPNFLLVDFYNIGNGTVFQVAAEANNVTYSGKCCGKKSSSASRLPLPPKFDPYILLGVLIVGAFSML